MAAGRRNRPPAGPRGPVTSIDVARRAGVSQSAVSRTFTPGASVSEATRAKVMEAARALGYSPNAIARSLITRRSRMIGVIVAYLDNHYYPLLLETLSQRLQREGYHTLLFFTQTGAPVDTVLQEILQYQVDGIIMFSAVLSSDLADLCAAQGIPVVLFNRTVDDAAVSSVSSDNVAGGRLVGRFLAAGGHARVAYVAGVEDSSTSRDRERGLVEGLAEGGLALHARAVGGYTLDGARLAALALFDRADPPDAIFVASDHMALAVLDTLRFELRLSVPDDVSVVGYDAIPLGAAPSYRLTSVRQPNDEMVAEAVRLILSRIGAGEDGGPERVALPVRLVVRESARRPAGHDGSNDPQ